MSSEDESLPYRDLVEFAIGGGWGRENAQPGYEPVTIIRGTDFERAQFGDLSSCPRRYEKSNSVIKRTLRDDDLLLEVSGGNPKTGQSTGRVCLYRDRGEDQGSTVIPASFCRLVRLRRDRVDPRFAYYSLKEMHSSGRARQYENQSTGISNFQFELFLDEEVQWLPGLHEQRRIAGLLGAFDDKIEHNEKLAGRCRVLADLAFQRAFPVVKGSERLGDYVSVVRGRSYTSGELVDSPTALVTLKSIKRGGGYSAGGLKPYSGVFKPDQVLAPGELVVAHTDLTQAGDVIGKPALVPSAAAYEQLVASLDLAIVRPRSDCVTSLFLYHLFLRDDFQTHAYGYANGSTVLHLSKEAIPEFAIDLPEPSELLLFDTLARPLHALASQAESEVEWLAAVRNALLPKLVGGALRVSEDYEPADLKSAA